MYDLVLVQVSFADVSFGKNVIIFGADMVASVHTDNTFNDLSNKVSPPNKTEDSNLSMLNIITGIDESRTLTKHVSCQCKCKFDGRRYNLNYWQNDENANVSVKNIMYVQKIMLSILLHVLVKNENLYG